MLAPCRSGAESRIGSSSRSQRRSSCTNGAAPAAVRRSTSQKERSVRGLAARSLLCANTSVARPRTTRTFSAAAVLLSATQRYEVGSSVWRARLPHLSAWDYNWPFVLPKDATAPAPEVATADLEDCQTTVSGSIIGCEDQTLGEKLPLAGTPYRLHYQSERMSGRTDLAMLEVALSGPSVPASLRDARTRS